MPTKIEWATDVWNPITGCTPISEGCQNCYAKRMANRLAGRYGYPKDDPFKVTSHNGHVYLKPTKWKKPRRIFVCSMGDLFHRDVDVDSQIYPSIIHMVRRTPQHTYLFLTKRPEKMKWVCERIWGNDLPKNAWFGVTAENQQRADERIPILLQIPTAVHFVSVEPMLGPVDMKNWLKESVVRHHTVPQEINWVICGGETGPNARPMESDWARLLRDQCGAVGVPFFFKKHGDWWCKQFNTDKKYRENFELDGQIWDQYQIVK